MIAIITKPIALISFPLYSNNNNDNNPNSSSPFLSFISTKKSPKRRRCRCGVQASSLVLPLLPFPTDQVLVPSEAKTLHLYEARFIALLEESLFEKNKLFVHFVLDPIGFSGTSSEASFAARYGCLVVIEKVERLNVGALVLIRGVGRVKVLSFNKIQPYLTGSVTPLQDIDLQKMAEITSKVLELKEVLHTLNSLEIKLKAPPEALLQTQTINSISWAEKQLSLDCISDFIPSMDERVSFAAFQPVSGASQSEMRKLQKEKLAAMDVFDTVERLEKSLELVRNNIAIVAAKLAIQSLEMP